MRKIDTYDMDGAAAVFFDHLPYAALVIGRDRVIRAVNSAAEDLGVEAGKHCWDSFGQSASIPPRDREHFERTGEPPAAGTKCTFCAADEALASGKAVIRDIPVGGKLWKTYWVPLDADTYLHYALEVTTGSGDLRHDEERLRRVQEIAAVGLWEQAIPGNLLTWCGQTCRIFGLPEDAPPPDFDAFLEMVHPEDREEIVRKTKRALASDGEPYRVVYRITRRDTGEQRIVHEEARIERDGTGAPRKMAGVIHDITEAQEERDGLVRKIREAEREIAELRGLIPICSQCKNIRDDKGLWKKVEEYFAARSDIEFSHGLCPKCSTELYPPGGESGGGRE